MGFWDLELFLDQLFSTLVPFLLFSFKHDFGVVLKIGFPGSERKAFSLVEGSSRRRKILACGGYFWGCAQNWFSGKRTKASHLKKAAAEENRGGLERGWSHFGSKNRIGLGDPSTKPTLNGDIFSFHASLYIADWRKLKSWLGVGNALDGDRKGRDFGVVLKIGFPGSERKAFSLEEGSSRRRKSFACGGVGGVDNNRRAVSKISPSKKILLPFVGPRNYLSSTMAAITGSTRDFSPFCRTGGVRGGGGLISVPKSNRAGGSLDKPNP
ncbi:hypothetical protein CEXT_595811 [Caerostris extrusa]|uniref:Ribosomal protein L2 n=1 Tax=Caerostris extrusa TaxID=172846 RepID=A0AAV4XYU5_CAEEX|nr:hypothetical protein CEXT_595811 [Caerostris extrusa]